MTLIRILLQDKDSEVKTEARNAVNRLALRNPQAEELGTRWMPKGEQQALSLEIIRQGNTDFISPRKLRKSSQQAK